MKLSFGKSVKIDRAYSSYDSVDDISELAMIRHFKHSIRNKVAPRKNGNLYHPEDIDNVYDSLNCYIKSQVGFRKHVAMMDIDHEDFKDEVSQKLTEMGIAHIVIESSPKRYWIIADQFLKNKRKVGKFVDNFPEVDPKYVRMSKIQGFVLRAYPKRGFVPIVSAINGEGSKQFLKFVELFEAYWKKRHISWIVQEYIMDMV